MSPAAPPLPDQLAIYGQIHILSGQMASAAQANDWDSLIALEGRVALLRDQLMDEPADAVALSADENRRKAEMIRNILKDDVEIRRHTEPWMENVRQLLGSQHQRRKMQQAYGDDATGNPAMTTVFR